MFISLFFIIHILVIGIAYFFKFRGYRTSQIWLLFVSTFLIEFLLLILFHPEDIRSFAIENWFNVGVISVTLGFEVDLLNWPLFLSYITILLAFFFTSIVNLDTQADLKMWSILITMITLASAAVLASNLWTVILFWTALDILEIYYRLVMEKKHHSPTFQSAIVFRFLGSFIFLFNTALLARLGINPSFGNLKAINPNFFLISAFLHSGVLPIEKYSSSKDHSETERIIDDGFRILLLFTSFSIMLHIPAPIYNLQMEFIVSILLLFIMIIIGLSLLLINESSSDISLILLFIANFLFYMNLHGADHTLIFWMVGFFLSIFSLRFYTLRNHSSFIFPLMMVLMLSGLPFSLNAFGARGFYWQKFDTFHLLLSIPLVVFLGGLIKSILAKNNDLQQFDHVYQTIYKVGLFIPVFSSTVVIYRFFVSIENEIIYWWSGLMMVFALVGVAFWLKSSKQIVSTSRFYNSMHSLLFQVLSFNWLSGLTSFVEEILNRIVNGFSMLLEGTGGILWAIVLLILILSSLL